MIAASTNSPIDNATPANEITFILFPDIYIPSATRAILTGILKKIRDNILKSRKNQ
ncbi:hypothetical protein GL2_08520 [Microbulbifer sp. GL-2]|nr:hypothetical protein GL2_08520 [Microbulbifer sp. GL-2]